MGRRQAETLMTATAVIERPTGEVLEDDETLETYPVMETIYSGKARLRMVTAAAPSEAAIPGAVAVKDELILSIPVDAEGSGDVRPNDIVTVTDNPMDPSVAVVQMRIAGVHHGTYMTARRFPLVEVS